MTSESRLEPRTLRLGCCDGGVHIRPVGLRGLLHGRHPLAQPPGELPVSLDADWSVGKLTGLQPEVPMLQGREVEVTPQASMQAQPTQGETTEVGVPSKNQAFSAVDMVWPFTVNW